MFKYITIANLRSIGISETDIPDESALELIAQASSSVNQLTGMWFLPVKGGFDLNGNSAKYLPLPAPFISFSDEKTVFEQSRHSYRPMIPRVGSFEPASVTGHPYELPTTVARKVGRGEMYAKPGDWYLKSTVNFPPGIENIRLDAFLGWVDKPIRRFETELTSDFEPEDAELEVSSASGFNKGKVILIMTPDESEVLYQTIVLSRDLDENTIEVDSANDLEDIIPSGSKVITFGKVPFQVVRATQMLMEELKITIADACADPHTNPGFISRLLQERTDTYSYSLARGDGLSAGGGGTYLSSLQLLLSTFTKPPFLGGV